jgi:hypothetical protein
MKKSRRRKNEENKRRFEAIKDLMSTFAMATVAVVATVTLIPASPKAEIIKAVALTDEIVYQVNITDEDNALDLSTVFVVLENQLEYYEQAINLGENSGYFDNLEQDTEYRLSVYGSKGFGQERLDTLKITTKEKIGGTILSVTPDQIDYMTVYTVDVSINDPTSNYTSVNLFYGYNYEHDNEFQYESINITSSRQTIELSDIYTTEAFHIYLQATTNEGFEVLDEIWVNPPFELYNSLYLEFINSQEIGFYLYTDLQVNHISYEMNIYKNELLIRSEEVILEHDVYEGSQFVIDGLTPNTLYNFECIATYQNPQTLRQETKIIYTEEITTLNAYTFTYTIDEFEDYYEVTVNLDDPNDNFQIAYYESFDTSGEHVMYIDSENYTFNNHLNEKNIVFTIYKPTATNYRIIIGMENQSNYLINQIIEIIIE